MLRQEWRRGAVNFPGISSRGALECLIIHEEGVFCFVAAPLRVTLQVQ